MFNLFLKNKLTHTILIVLSFTLITPISVFANDNIEIIYYGHRDETAFVGLGQGLEDSSEQYGGLKFRLKTELENFRPYNGLNVKALFVSMGTESIRILSALNPQIPIFNLVDDSNEVRAMCLPNVFHILPSEQMKDKALEDWKNNNSDADDETLEALAWDAGYKEGKAYVLNIKFKEKRSIELSEQGWSGWVAAKIFSDALVKSQKDNSNIIDVLKNDISINVYKGLDSSFGKDGQLKQVVLIKNAEKVIGQMPEKGDESTSLDSIEEFFCK